MAKSGARSKFSGVSGLCEPNSFVSARHWRGEIESPTQHPDRDPRRRCPPSDRHRAPSVREHPGKAGVALRLHRRRQRTLDLLAHANARLNGSRPTGTRLHAPTNVTIAAASPALRVRTSSFGPCRPPTCARDRVTRSVSRPSVVLRVSLASSVAALVAADPDARAAARVGTRRRVVARVLVRARARAAAAADSGAFILPRTISLHFMGSPRLDETQAGCRSHRGSRRRSSERAPSTWGVRADRSPVAP